METYTENEARLFWALVGEPGRRGIARVVRTLGYQGAADAALEGKLEHDLQAEFGRKINAVKRELSDGKTMWDIAGLDDATHFVTPDWEDYPSHLAHMHAPPHGLFLSGAGATSLKRYSVYVAGSLAATSYGKIMAEMIAGRLANHGVGIVSTGAYGIETAALRAAAAYVGDRIVVSPCGWGHVYPSANEKLIQSSATSGTVVSEVAPGALPTRRTLLRAHRLAAAIAQNVIVVESALGSGSMQAVDGTDSALPLRLGAVPGPCTSAGSTGPHKLLSEGALLVTPENVVELFGSAQMKED